jgi:hypothetical protein
MITNAELQAKLPNGWQVRDGRALVKGVTVKHATKGEQNVSLVVTPRDSERKNLAAFISKVGEVERASL